MLTEKTLWQLLLVSILMPMMLYGVFVTITEITLMNLDKHWDMPLLEIGFRPILKYNLNLLLIITVKILMDYGTLMIKNCGHQLAWLENINPQLISRVIMLKKLLLKPLNLNMDSHKWLLNMMDMKMKFSDLSDIWNSSPLKEKRNLKLTNSHSNSPLNINLTEINMMENYKFTMWAQMEPNWSYLSF